MLPIVAITLASTAPPGRVTRRHSANAVTARSKAYEIGPTGTQFAVPVTLTFKYGGLDLHGSDPTDLEVATIADGAWVRLAGNAVDTSAQVASGQTTHLSPYGLHAKGKVQHEDSGQTQDSGDTDSSTNDSGSNDGGSNDSGSNDGGSDAGFDAAGCTQAGSQFGTCANLPMQICIQGYTFTNCVTMGQGYTGWCCPTVSTF